MTWSFLIQWAGYGVILVGILFLIWSLLRKGVSVLGVGLMIAGFLLLILAAFLE
jgi:hypothetical protein